MDISSEEKNFSASEFVNPDEVVSQMDLKPSDYVADFGCGTGYFVFPLAKKTKGQGRVYALDILKEKLESVESQAKILGLTNILTKRVNLEKEGGSKLDSESVDWVVLADMIFQNKNKDEIFKEVKRVLKPGGKILVVEWNFNDASVGPERALRISREGILEIAQRNQLTVLKDVQAGNFHYGLILAK